MKIQNQYELEMIIENKIIDMKFNNEMNVMSFMPLVVNGNMAELSELGNLDLLTMYNINKL